MSIVLDRLQFGSMLRGYQFVDGKYFLFTMDRQSETLRKQRSQHLVNLISGGGTGGLRSDVISCGCKPIRSRDLIGPDVVRRSDEVFQADVCGGNHSWTVAPMRTIIAGFVWPHRGDLERQRSGCIGLGLREFRRRVHDAVG